MKRKEVSSSMIRTIGYDKEEQILEIEFGKDRVFQYKEFPEEAYNELIEAESVGKFFNAKIKNIYEYVKVEENEMYKL